MKWPLMLLLLCSLPSFVSANTGALGQAGDADCDGACSQQQAAGGESAGVLVAALGPIANVQAISEIQRSSLCTYAKERSWDDMKAYAVSQGLAMNNILENIVCTMADTTDNPYPGNVFHMSARYSGYIGDVVRYASRYLLKDNNYNNVFVGLVRGIGGRENIFTELKNSWTNMPGRRGDIEIAARTICLSIDRFNVSELASIRNTECKQEPFIF